MIPVLAAVERSLKNAVASRFTGRECHYWKDFIVEG